MTPALEALAAMRKVIAGAAAIARVDVQHAGGAVFEAHRECAFVEFELFHHVAVEGGGGAGDLLALQHVERRVQQDAVQIQADAAEIGAAQGEARVEIVVGADAGKALHGAQRIVGQDAGEILGVVAGQHQSGGAVLARRFEGAGLDFDGVGLAEGFGAEDDLEFLGLAGIQVEGLLHQVIADGGDVEDVIAGR